MGPLTLPISAHSPQISPRPASVTKKVCPGEGRGLHGGCKTANPAISSAGGLLAPALATPMFKGALTEWLPTLGLSWQVPQTPSMLGRLRTSLRPVTPVMLIFVVLNTSSPRATDRRDCASSLSDLSPSHGLYKSKILGSKGRPVGFNPTGSFTPTKNLESWSESAIGPPVAPRACRLPASSSKICAVKIPVSKSTICFCWSAVGAAVACAWMRVASMPCCARLDSRPSHMIVVRKPRLVDGRGRRYIDTIPVVGDVRPVAGLVVQP